MHTIDRVTCPLMAHKGIHGHLPVTESLPPKADLGVSTRNQFLALMPVSVGSGATRNFELQMTLDGNFATMVA